MPFWQPYTSVSIHILCYSVVLIVLWKINLLCHQKCHYLIDYIRLPIQFQQKLCIYLLPFSSYGVLFKENHRF